MSTVQTERKRPHFSRRGKDLGWVAAPSRAPGLLGSASAACTSCSARAAMRRGVTVDRTTMAASASSRGGAPGMSADDSTNAARAIGGRWQRGVRASLAATGMRVSSVVMAGRTCSSGDGARPKGLVMPAARASQTSKGGSRDVNSRGEQQHPSAHTRTGSSNK